MKRILFAIPVTLLSIAVMFIMTRLMGQRQIAQLSMYDYITGITIGSIAAELATTGPGEDIAAYVAAMVLYAAAEILLAVASDKSLFLRQIIEGRPLVLYDKGKLIVKNLSRAKMDVNEFLAIARGQGYFNIADLEYVLLEPNGKVSFLPHAAKRPLTPEDMSLAPEQERPVHPVILNGKTLEKNLIQLGYDIKWLNERLGEQNAPTPDKIILATCDHKGKVTVYPDDG
ncbi:MAG: DUF421 domain-containing protein [Eubacteriales bacterium]|nr:DUF421 domain-containing protein [Eubacteriales bacterium]